MTEYVLTNDDARKDAGAVKALALFNADKAVPITMGEFLLEALAPQLTSWADTHAPASIPLGDWLARWTDAERDGAFTLGGQNADIRALWIEMLKHPTVQPDNQTLQTGVRLVCAALEQEGVITTGQAAARAAAISAY